MEGRAGVLNRLRRVLDPADHDLAGRLSDFNLTADLTVTVIAVVLPRATEPGCHRPKLCREAGVAVVPQGGMSGIAAGAVPV